jgi:hypothetical protein
MSTCSGIYTKDIKLIEKNIKDENMSIDEKGNLYLTKDNKYAKEYNPNGKLIKTSSKYDIKMLINEYIVAIKNNNLILSTINNKEIKIGTWDNKNNKLETSLSGINIDDENNEKELYLIVEDKKLTINDAWKECQKDDCEFDSIEELENQKLGYEYYYDLITKKIGRRVRIIYE